MAKKVSGASDYVIPLVVLGGVGVALYFIFRNGGLTGLLESKSNTQNNTDVSTATTAAGATLSTQGQTRSDADINGIATTIYNAGSSNDGGKIASALSGLGNEADFNRLYQIFGTKDASDSWFSSCNLLGFDCQKFDLFAWVRSIVSTDQRNEINSMLDANGITSQF